MFHVSILLCILCKSNNEKRMKKVLKKKEDQTKKDRIAHRGGEQKSRNEGIHSCSSYDEITSNSTHYYTIMHTTNPCIGWSLMHVTIF